VTLITDVLDDLRGSGIVPRDSGIWNFEKRCKIRF